MKKYKRFVNNKMKWQGETDTDKRVIRINKKKSKRKSTILDTIVHEETHAAHPRMTEKTVYKLTPKKVKKMSKRVKRKLYSRYR